MNEKEPETTQAAEVSTSKMDIPSTPSAPSSTPGMPVSASPVAEPPKKKGKGNMGYVITIAVLATLLLIVAGLFATGKIMMVPSGANMRVGGPGGANFEQFEGQRPSEEELEEMRKSGQIPDMPQNNSNSSGSGSASGGPSLDSSGGN